MAENGLYSNPDDMWDAFETGTILIESDNGKKTTVYYKLLNTPTNLDANSS